MNWIAYLANHLWQSTLFAGVMWGLAALLKKNRAAVRYGVWMAASVKFLVPFALLVSLGTSLGAHWGWKATPRIVTAPAAMAVEEIEQPFEVADVTPHVSVVTAQVPGARHQMYVFWELKQYLPQTLLLVWALGFLLGAGLWVRRVWRMRGLRRAGEAVEIPGVIIPVLMSRTKMEPCVFGVMRPVLLLPEGIAEQLTAEQMRGVVEHELNHVRRRDNLTAAAHAAVETVFWFWPVVRWMRLRLVEERERACDEAVLRAGGDADVYAESILKVCKFYLAAQPMVAAGVSGSDLRRRIEAIVSYRGMARMSVMKKMVLGAMAAMAAMAVGMPVVFGQMSAARRTAMVDAVRPVEKTLEPMNSAASAGQPQGFEPKRLQETADMKRQEKPAVPSGDSLGKELEFEVATIKLTSPGEPRLMGTHGPGGFQARNVTVRDLIFYAYDLKSGDQLTGLSGWTTSDHYDVEAKGSEDDAAAINKLPMLDRPAPIRRMVQSLLAERFHLKVSHTNKIAPIYELTVTKDGFKGVESELVPDDPDNPGSAQHPKEGMYVRLGGPGVLEAHGVPMSLLERILSGEQDLGAAGPFSPGRLVVDKTGLTGFYDWSLAWVPQWQLDQGTKGISLFTALQEQLGLKLMPAKGPVDVIVVDHVERPSEN